MRGQIPHTRYTSLIPNLSHTETEKETEENTTSKPTQRLQLTPLPLTTHPLNQPLHHPKHNPQNPQSHHPLPRLSPRYYRTTRPLLPTQIKTLKHRDVIKTRIPIKVLGQTRLHAARVGRETVLEAGCRRVGEGGERGCGDGGEGEGRDEGCWGCDCSGRGEGRVDGGGYGARGGG